MVMNSRKTQTFTIRTRRGFTLVEVLVVVAIISILLTAGVIGLSSVGGRAVTSGVDSAEALFEEARSMAVNKNIRTAVLVSQALTNNRAEDRRKMLVVHEELGTNGDVIRDAQGKPVATPNWQITSRGIVLPDQTFFSSVFSKLDHRAGTGTIPTLTDARIKDVKTIARGSYYIYEFNTQGIPKNEWASVVIGSGVRNLTQTATSQPPKTIGSARRDFGGFVVWRNGRTSVFSAPQQISSSIQSITAGTTF
jgi:prepilin-type N-terminal cleavage/methylation domain-containing protein